MPLRQRKKPSGWVAIGGARAIWLAIAIIVVLLLVFLAAGPVVNVHDVFIAL